MQSYYHYLILKSPQNKKNMHLSAINLSSSRFSTSQTVVCHNAKWLERSVSNDHQRLGCKDKAQFPLAMGIQSPGAPWGESFWTTNGMCFRTHGKTWYARPVLQKCTYIEIHVIHIRYTAGISDVWNMPNGQDSLSIQLLQIIQGAIFVVSIHNMYIFQVMFDITLMYPKFISNNMFFLVSFVYSIAFHIKLHSWGKEGGALGTSSTNEKNNHQPGLKTNCMDHHYHGNPQPSFFGGLWPICWVPKAFIFHGFWGPQVVGGWFTNPFEHYAHVKIGSSWIPKQFFGVNIPLQKNELPPQEIINVAGHWPRLILMVTHGLFLRIKIIIRGKKTNPSPEMYVLCIYI